MKCFRVAGETNVTVGESKSAMGPTRRRVTVLEMASIFTWAEAAAPTDLEKSAAEGRDSTIVPTFDITISH